MSGLIPAGSLNRTITLQTATKTQSPTSGAEIIDWDDVNEVRLPAAKLEGNSREVYQAAQRLASYVECVFRIRYRTRPSPENQRIICDDLTYDLKPPLELGLREGWDIPAVARGEVPEP